MDIKEKEETKKCNEINRLTDYIKALGKIKIENGLILGDISFQVGPTEYSSPMICRKAMAKMILVSREKLVDQLAHLHLNQS